jgi:hypothetical protein
MTLGALLTFAQPKVAPRDAVRWVSENVPVVVDSGAWSVHTGSVSMSVAQHSELVRSFPTDAVRFVGLDVIGDAESSWSNWKRQRDAGLAVEPTIHYGADPKIIDRYVSAGLASEWVNLGGLVLSQRKRTESGMNQVAGWCAAVMKRQPDLRFHGLGCTAPMLNRIIPFGSVDSTYWLAFGKFRQLNLFDPNAGNWITLYVPRRGRTKEIMERSWKRAREHHRLLSDTYGISLDFLSEADDDALARISVMSQFVFASYYGRRHGTNMVCYLAGSSTAWSRHLLEFR